MSSVPEDALRVRRAKQQDLAAIASMMREGPAEAGVGELEVRDWLFSRGLWVADDGQCLRGVAGWQAENLVAVTDVFHISPSRQVAWAGGPLLEKIELEAAVLMCEANVLVLPKATSAPIRTFLRDAGYEAVPLEDLHSIWREVLRDFLTGDQELMVKRLRERMVMVPL